MIQAIWLIEHSHYLIEIIMKNPNYLFLLAFASLLFFSSCDKDDEPTALELTFADLNFTIDENPTVGQEIATAKAVVNRGDITYTLSSQNPAGAMNIDAKMGNLTVANASLFDFETNPTLTATATATVEGVSKSAKITVTLRDVNEIVPTVITISDFSATIDENPSNGMILGTISATTNQGNLAYAITSQAPAGAIAINARTGEMTVADASQFDFETNPTLTATVEASANGETKSATITITLNDVVEIIAGTPFVTKWNVEVANGTVTIPVVSGISAYDFNVDWGDGNTDSNQSAKITHTYSATGIYEVSISGDFPGINFNVASSDEKERLVSIEQWGNQEWESLESAFDGCSNMVCNATDVPNLSKVTSLASMFRSTALGNNDFNNWDVSTITNISRMFYISSFSGKVGNWDVSNVENMIYMFNQASNFQDDLSNWNVSNTKFFSWMFANTNYNQDISSWDMRNAETVDAMFFGNRQFNQDISGWEFENLRYANIMFKFAEAFNQDLSGWDVSKVTSMSGMFQGASSFNSDLSGWDVSNVSRMDFMFQSAFAFESDLNSWKVGSAITIKNMFASNPNFATDVSGWDVSNVTDMSGVFYNSPTFNTDLSGWDVSNVVDMSYMFQASGKFGDISGWDVSKVRTMFRMFAGARNFDQNLAGWDVSSVTNMEFMLSNSAISIANYDATLQGWTQLPNLQVNVKLGVQSIKYCTLGETARTALMNNKNWTFDGDLRGTASECR